MRTHRQPSIPWSTPARLYVHGNEVECSTLEGAVRSWCTLSNLDREQCRVFAGRRVPLPEGMIACIEAPDLDWLMIHLPK